MKYSTDILKGQENWKMKIIQLQSKLLSLKILLPSIISKTKDDKTLEMIEHYQNMFIGFDTTIELFKRDINSMNNTCCEKIELYHIKNKKVFRLESEMLLAEEMITDIGKAFHNALVCVLPQ